MRPRVKRRASSRSGALLAKWSITISRCYVGDSATSWLSITFVPLCFARSIFIFASDPRLYGRDIFTCSASWLLVVPRVLCNHHPHSARSSALFVLRHSCRFFPRFWILRRRIIALEFGCEPVFDFPCGWCCDYVRSVSHCDEEPQWKLVVPGITSSLTFTKVTSIGYL